MKQDPCLAVESAMTAPQRRAAYARFVGENPEYRGAYWSDILDALDNCGRHDDVVETVMDAVDWSEVDALLPYLGMAVLSLMYADGMVPSASEAIALARVAAEEPG